RPSVQPGGRPGWGRCAWRNRARFLRRRGPPPPGCDARAGGRRDELRRRSATRPRIPKLEYGPLLAQFGRDVLVLGPAVRGALMVSSNAAPQDGFRIQLRPVQLPLIPMKLSLFYFIDRLRAPQRFPGTIADCMRIQFDVA